MGAKEERPQMRMLDEGQNRTYGKAQLHKIIEEGIAHPAAWSYADFPWLTDEELRELEHYPFDFGDILLCETRFLSSEQIQSRLLCNAEDLDSYCLIVFEKPWPVVHEALSIAARDMTVDEVFRPWAEQGNSTALAIMAHNVVKLDKESSAKEMRVRIINDLDSN